MMGYVTSSMRQFNQRSVRALIDQKFHRAPKGHGCVELHESVFASPTAEKQDAHGGERLEHKEERTRFSLYQELGNPLRSRLASPLASTCQRFDRDARPAIHGCTTHNLRVGNNYVRYALKFLELLVEFQAHRLHLNYQG